MAKKKANRASSAGMGMNPWLKYPALPDDTFGVIGDDMSPLQSVSNPSEMETMANDAYLQKLMGADALAERMGTPAPTAPVPPPTPPLQDTRVPAPAEMLGYDAPPVGSMSTLGVPTTAPKAGNPGYLGRSAEETDALAAATDPNIPTTNLNMAPLGVQVDLNGQPVLQDPTGPKLSPYEKHERMQEAQKRAQHTALRNRYQSPEQARMLLDIVRGISHPQTGFEQEPVLDENGKQLILDNQPVTKNGNPIYDMNQSEVDPTNPYQMATAGIDRQERTLSDLLSGAPVQRDLSPLLNYLGTLSGKDVLKGYKAPGKFSETLEKVLAGRKGLNDQQLRLMSESTAAAKGLKDGSDTSLAAQLLTQRFTDETGLKPDSGQGIADRQEAGRIFRAHEATTKLLKNDKPMLGMLSTYQTLGNAMGVILHPKGTIPEQINEFQGLIRQAIGTGPTGAFKSTGSERESAVAHTFGWNLEKLAQFLNGKPADIAKNDVLLKHLMDVAGTEQQSVRHEFQTRLRAVAGGHDYMYDDQDPFYNEELHGRYKRSLDSLLGNVRGQMDGIGATPISGGRKEIETRILNPVDKEATKHNRELRLEKEKGKPKLKAVESMTPEELRRELGQ